MVDRHRPLASATTSNPACRASSAARARGSARSSGRNPISSFRSEFPSRHLQACLDSMDIDEDYFWQVVDKFRPAHLWERKDGEWHLAHRVQ